MTSPTDFNDSFHLRHYHYVNWLGFWNLYLKEVKRFFKVIMQTVAAPVVTTLLFLAIFSLALGRAVETISGIPFIEFLAPGLITMAMAQNAFANSSSSIITGKIQGNIIDVLMPPISPGEFVTAYILAAITRGVLVGIVTWFAMLAFIDLPLSYPIYLLYFAIAASMMMGSIGILAAIWAEKFDHIASITNFIITPFSFLSGTFYSITRLPEPFQTLAHFNPFFYMIDGFRYGAIGHADTDPIIGIVVLTLCNIILWLAAYRLIANGYKIKA